MNIFCCCEGVFLREGVVIEATPSLMAEFDGWYGWVEGRITKSGGDF